MSNKEIHIVTLQYGYAVDNYWWMNPFTHESSDGELNHYVFACFSYQGSDMGFVEFEVPKTKEEDLSTVEHERILLPQFAVAGILLDEARKNRLGFLP